MTAPGTLLAVDLGLRTGLALYGEDGRLRWFRSHNLGNAGRLRRAAQRVLAEHGDGLALLVLEGPRDLAEIWQRVAARRGVAARNIAAETWRERLLLPRQRRRGPLAKRHAGRLARRVIRWSQLPGPPSLRHDAAEAILVGLFCVLDLGWLDRLPQELR